MLQKFLRRFWPGLCAAAILCPAQTWAAELDNVEVKSFTSRDFKLEDVERANCFMADLRKCVVQV